MPAPQNKRSALEQKKSSNKKPLLILGAVILIVIGGLFANSLMRYQNNKAIEADRVRFEQAVKDVQRVAQAIVEVTGQPYKTQENKSCTRPSIKLGEAPLSCTVVQLLFYEINSESTANDLLENIGTILIPEWEFVKVLGPDNSQNKASFNKLESNNYNRDMDYQVITLRYINKSINMECDNSNLMYNSLQPPFEEYPISNKSPIILAVSIDCNSVAKAEYFKIRD